LVAREQDDQDKRDHDNSGRGVEVEGKRDGQVVTLPEYMEKN
jgi:hypothetical protein